MKLTFFINEHGKPYSREMFLNWLADCFLQRKNQWITIEIKKQTKTDKQLGYYYTAIIPAVRKFLLESGYMGKTLSAENIDYFLKISTGYIKTIEVKDKAIDVPLSKADMTVDEMSDFIDKSIIFLGGIGCFVPPPKKRGRQEDVVKNKPSAT